MSPHTQVTTYSTIATRKESTFGNDFDVVWSLPLRPGRKLHAAFRLAVGRKTGGGSERHCGIISVAGEYSAPQAASIGARGYYEWSQLPRFLE
jgi:hypothetical protein